MKEEHSSEMLAFERLKTLYSISKLLSHFESVEISMPKIFLAVEKSFPLLTAVIIDHWSKIPHATIWHSADANPELIKAAVLNAKRNYLYLTGGTEAPADFLDQSISKNDFVFTSQTSFSGKISPANYIIMPLIIDGLPPLGVLQLEGASSLDEFDIHFVDALSDIVGVALDRYHKTQQQNESQRKKDQIKQSVLNKTHEKVLDLETERELRETFVSLLTHDLRTPLTSILASAQFILKRPNDIEMHHTSATRIVNSVQRAGKMITDLLDANFLRSGDSLPVNKSRMDLSASVKNTISELTTNFGDRFVFHAPNSLFCHLDANGVRRILENLCSNAVKYGFPATPISITVKDLDDLISLSVNNVGAIISKDELNSLFEQYRRSDSAKSSAVKGWGIGLSLVKGVAEAHGGHVLVESNLENGTTFTVVLPKN